MGTIVLQGTVEALCWRGAGNGEPQLTTQGGVLEDFWLQPAKLGCFQSFLGNAISFSRGDVLSWGIFSLQEHRNHIELSFSR